MRDERSYKTLHEIGIENKNVKVTADPALDLDIADEKLGKAILKNEGVRVIKTARSVGKKVAELGGDFETQIANAL